MKVRELRIFSYKGIEDSGEVSLGESYTVVVGKNNSGKTAFLERLALTKLQNKPYLKNKAGLFQIPTASRTVVKVSLSGEELKWLLLQVDGTAFVPLPGNYQHLSRDQQIAYANEDQFLKREFSVVISWAPPNGWQPFEGSTTSQLGLMVRGERSTGRLDVIGPAQQLLSLFSEFIIKELHRFSFVFKAERMALATSGPQSTLELSPDASNLAGALNQLQGSNFALFQRFNELVTSILPTVRWVSVIVSPQSNNLVTIKVWNEAPSTDEDTHGHGLDDSGTGVGQVLAILFTVMTHKHGRLIVIDEPNSFLHPSAARALIDTLRQYPQHQYVISTHAPEIIAAVAPEKLILAKWENARSEISVHDGSDIEAAVHALTEVGVRLSDVFGYDAIVWVEGQTEAMCFPLLKAETKSPRESKRIGFVALINTGDLEAKRADARAAWQIYSRLSTQSALVPQVIAFSLDREDRTISQVDDLIRESKGRLKFLPYRVYESFLIHPKAIADVMPSVGSTSDVETWLMANGGNKEFRASVQWKSDIYDANWLAVVDGARLLASLFSELTPSKELFRKTSHSVALTRWLLAHAPQHLELLRNYVAGLTDTSKSAN